MSNSTTVDIPKVWFGLAVSAYSASREDNFEKVKEDLSLLQWKMRTDEDEKVEEKIEIDQSAWSHVINSLYAIQAGDIGSCATALEKANRYFPLEL